MTGYLDSGASNPLSKLSIAVLQDMGYRVDFSQADPYTPPRCCSSSRVRALSEFSGIGMGEGKFPRPGLSNEGRARAEEYGRLKLREEKANGPTNRQDGDVVFVGDLFTSVLIEEDGHIYQVDVIGS
jgi:hypothetical protein